MQRNVEDTKERLLLAAHDGDRVVHVVEPKPKTIWGGLGNRSGLHSYAYTAISDKWKKSGERFGKKLGKIVQPGEKFQIQQFRNINRDRGRWAAVRTIEVA